MNRFYKKTTAVFVAFLMVFSGLNIESLMTRSESAVARTTMGFGGIMMGAKAGALLGASLGAIGGPIGVTVGAVAGAIGGGLGGGAIGGRIGGWVDNHLKLGKNAGMLGGAVLGAGIGALALGPVGFLVGAVAGGLIGRFFGGTIDKLITPMRVAKWGGAYVGAKAGAAIGTAILPVGGTILGGIAGAITGLVVGKKFGPGIDKLFGGQGTYNYSQVREPEYTGSAGCATTNVVPNVSFQDTGDVRTAYENYIRAKQSYEAAVVSGNQEYVQSSLENLKAAQAQYNSFQAQ